jgi:hypothetical protein
VSAASSGGRRRATAAVRATFWLPCALAATIEVASTASAKAIAFFI